MDAADLSIWKDNFGAGLATASENVSLPEPDSLALSLLAVPTTLLLSPMRHPFWAP